MPKTAPSEITRIRLEELLATKGVSPGVIDLIAGELRVGYRARRLLATLQQTVNKVPPDVLIGPTRRGGRVGRG